jgi:hypothetical protein
MCLESSSTRCARSRRPWAARLAEGPTPGDFATVRRKRDLLVAADPSCARPSLLDKDYSNKTSSELYRRDRREVHISTDSIVPFVAMCLSPKRLS